MIMQFLTQIRQMEPIKQIFFLSVRSIQSFPSVLIITVLLILPLLTSTAVSHAQASAELNIQPAIFYIGEPVEAHLIILHQPKTHYQSIDINWQHAELLTDFTVTATDNSTTILFTFTIWEPGSYTLSPITAVFTNEAGAQITAVSNPIQLTVPSVLNENDLTLRPNQPQASPPNQPVPWQWLLLFFPPLLFIWHKKRQQILPQQPKRLHPAQQTALDALAQVEQKPPSTWQEFGKTLFLIMRQFLIHYYQLGGKEQTTTELNNALSNRSISRATISSIGKCLCEFDRFQFDASPPSPTRTHEQILSEVRAVIMYEVVSSPSTNSASETSSADILLTGKSYRSR